MREFGIYTLVGSVFIILAFTQILITLFGKNIPNILTSFFKGAEEFVLVGLACIFIVAWMRKARPQKNNSGYELIVFDVYGNNTQIDGLRTIFRTNDVATSFMKYYKQMYSVYNFAVITDINETRRTIVRYI